MTNDTELCTVDFAANRLQLHPKTVLRFIHDGRLRATRIGKAYRIVRADLESFAGVPPPVDTPAEAAWVTSIVDVPGVSAELAQKCATAIPAALKGKRESPMRADVVYDPVRSQLKIILAGVPGDTAKLLGLIQMLLKQVGR